jgi:hypothetical protein
VLDDLRSGKLVRVLPQYRLRPFNVYALYVSRRYLDAKVRTLIAWLRNELTPALEQFEREAEQLAAATPAAPVPNAANATNTACDARAPRQTSHAPIHTVH